MKQSDFEEKLASYSGVFHTPPTRIPSRTITDAPLLGNGDLGVACGGDGAEQVYFLSKNDFYKLAHINETPKQRLSRLINDKGRRTGTRIVTFGQMTVAIPALTGGSYYTEQDILHGNVKGKFEKDSLKVETTAFVSGRHGGENLFILSVKTNEKIDIKFSLSPGEYNEYEVDGYADILDGEHHYVTYNPNIQNSSEKQWAAASLRVIGANVTYNQDLDKIGCLTLEPGAECFFCTAVASNLDDENPVDYVCSLTDSLTYHDIIKRQQQEEEWWRNYYNRSRVMMSDDTIMQFYYSSLYILGCCTRSDEPMPGLFGNWITTDKSLWSGSYTLNYNYEAPFWELETSNRSDITESYPDTLLRLIPLGKAFAEYFLGKKGVYLPVEIGPFGTVCSMLFHNQRTNAAYACVNLIRHFYYTWDELYAKRVYPFLKEVADFWEDYLFFEDGRYVIYEDCVHEEYISTHDKNSMMALGLVRYLFNGISVIAREIHIDEEKQDKWRHIVDNLSGYTVYMRNGREVFRYTESGREWNTRCPVTIQTIYPLGMFGIDSDDRLRRIAYNTFEERDDWEDENKFCSFFASGARIGHDPDDLLNRLHSHCEKFGQTNGFINHKGGGIENCNGVLSCLHEMMFQSYEGVLRFFPNWPESQNAEFTDLRAQGAFTVSSAYYDREIEFIEIKSEKGRECTVCIPWKEGAEIYRNGKFERYSNGQRETLKTSPQDIIRLKKRTAK